MFVITITYLSACQPRKDGAIYLCVRCIDIASFYDFPIEIWNCSDSVVFFYSPTNMYYYSPYKGHGCTKHQAS